MKIEDKILYLYNLGKTPKEIIEIVPLSRTKIYKILKNNLESYRKIRDYNRKYVLNTSYFEKIDTEEKAYFLGFLYADGCVSLSNKTVSINLQERDKEILEKFSLLLDSSRPLRFLKGECQNCQNQYGMYISSIKVCEDLIKLGCTPKKSLTLKFPTEDQVPKKLIHHFIRGYFDGDGCISSSKEDSVAKYNSFTLVGTENFLLNICKIFEEKQIVKSTKLRLITNITCALSYSGSKNCISLKEYLYENATIYLSRKFDKFSKVQELQKGKNKKKLQKNEIKIIIQMIEDGKSSIHIAELFKSSYGTINRIKNKVIKNLNSEM